MSDKILKNIQVKEFLGLESLKPFFMLVNMSTIIAQVTSLYMEEKVSTIKQVLEYFDKLEDDKKTEILIRSIALYEVPETEAIGTLSFAYRKSGGAVVNYGDKSVYKALSYDILIQVIGKVLTSLLQQTSTMLFFYQIESSHI